MALQAWSVSWVWRAACASPIIAKPRSFAISQTPLRVAHLRGRTCRSWQRRQRVCWRSNFARHLGHRRALSFMTNLVRSRMPMITLRAIRWLNIVRRPWLPAGGGEPAAPPRGQLYCKFRPKSWRGQRARAYRGRGSLPAGHAPAPDDLATVWSWSP